ncbi:RNase adapter RapZ [Arsenicicoccus piscis]|uniref:RNase adapter RapZ n=1 Tax=Arsenicicoccus piscis TaxID=673954 RepID=UPI001F4CD73E|nr:RNase adapter RapZ [Arsenicicoccus piscis]MCH8628700.1 RNase adapter RapZ [Arsenicicoccus piscis]
MDQPTAELTPLGPGHDFVIVTGMSGAGRSVCANVLEDSGWYVTDNLPPKMLHSLGEMIRKADADSPAGVRRVAAVVDVRSRGFFDALSEAIQELHDDGWRPRVVFLDATDETLVRRFESVRRPHPLQGDGGLLDGIRRERELLGDLRSQAEVILDTSGFNVHQLAAKVGQIFDADRGPRLRVAVMSFGFKYGIPLDADIVLDMRFLPNPFWIPELRGKTGRDPEVAAFVFDRLGAAEFVTRTVAMLDAMISGYVREGRRYITLAVGCTGGKHRSVAVAERLAAELAGGEVGTLTVHRDLGRE